MAAWNKGFTLCCKSRRKERSKETKGSCYGAEKAARVVGRAREICSP